MFTDAQLAALNAPLDPAHVKSRTGGFGRALSYIETHRAIRTANDIFGVGNWGYTVEELTLLGNPEPTEKDGRVGYRAAYRAVVRVTAGDTTFSDVGYGDGMDYSGSALTVQELAAKEAVSDGVKRALKNFGDPFGLVLYDKEGRKSLETKVGLATASPAKLKREVWKIGREQTGKDKPSAADIAAVFDVSAQALADDDVLRSILKAEGVL